MDLNFKINPGLAWVWVAAALISITIAMVGDPRGMLIPFAVASVINAFSYIGDSF
jgi:hypothetical protein